MKPFLLATLLVSGISSIAQTSRFENEWNLPGQLIKYPQTAIYVRELKGISATKATSLQKSINQVLAGLYKMPQLNPPKGFDAVPFMVVPRWVNDQRFEPVVQMIYYFRALTKDAKSGRVKRSRDGTDFHLDINGLDGFFDRVGNYWDECDKLHLPQFFEEVPVTDSTADYLEINFKDYGYPYVSNNVKNSPIRIVLGNPKPLLIPLTRKEFLQFLIAKKEMQIKGEQKKVDELPEQIAESKKVLAGLFTDSAVKSDPSLKRQIDQTIKANEDAFVLEQQKLKLMQEKLQHYRQFMNAMSRQEASAPVRLDYKVKSEELLGGLEQLVPIGRKEGVLLQRVNPEYYNRSLNAPASQSITLYYMWPQLGFVHDPDPLQQATMDIFNHLDYHKLKESFQ